MIPALAYGQCAQLQRQQVQAMGSVLRVAVCPRAGEVVQAQAAIQQVIQEFKRLEQDWSTWVPTSDVSRLNAQAGLGPVTVSAQTWAVLQRARRGSEQTQGLFDVTFSPLGALWRFDTPPGAHEPTRLQSIPTQAQVQEQLQKVGWQDLIVDAIKPQAALRRKGMSVHLGGLGKGAAVDRGVAILRAQGLVSFAIQAGGDLYCAGKNGERPWRIGIAHPRHKGELLGEVDIEDAAFSTSGDYERFAIIDGKRYHHILDTRTGWPATASQSVTVRAPSATDAEVMTKAAFILGGPAGVALVERLGGQALIVDSQGTVFQSKSLHVVATGGRP